MRTEMDDRTRKMISRAIDVAEMAYVAVALLVGVAMVVVMLVYGLR